MSHGRRRFSGRPGGHLEGPAPLCLYAPADAGNPAVMAPRFRPVALRLRLSTGLLKQLPSNMPKIMSRNKRRKAPVRSRTGPTSAPLHSVKELLARRGPVLRHVTTQASRQNFWNGWLSTHLAPEIRPRVSGVTERDGTLVIFAETAAWSARLRYAILELEREIRTADPDLIDIEVRVLPRS